MGELAPIIVLIFIALVVVAVVLLNKSMSSKQVVKSLTEADLIERDMYLLTAKEALELSELLKQDATKALKDKKGQKTSLLLPEIEDRKTKMLTFNITP